MKSSTAWGCAIGSWLAMASAGGAQDEAAARKEPPSKPSFRFFEKPVDLWQTGRGTREGNRTRGDSQTQSKPPAGDWGQVVRTPSGDLVLRELPEPLVAVLEDPSPENIRAFFEWRLGKARKILKAAQKIKEFRPAMPREAEMEEKGRPAKPVPTPPAEMPSLPKGGVPGGSSPKPGVQVTYFHKTGCPPCDAQDGILKEWLKDKPRAGLDIVEFGTQSELWREHQVRGTPSLLIRDPGTGRTAFLEGLSDRRKLDEAHFGLSQAPAPGRQGGVRK